MKTPHTEKKNVFKKKERKENPTHVRQGAESYLLDPRWSLPSPPHYFSIVAPPLAIRHDRG